MHGVVLILLLLSSFIVSANEVRSDLGYRITIPDHWLVLSRDIMQRSSTFQSAKHIDGIDDQLWQQVKPMIVADSVEMYVHPVQDGRGFSDNVNVIRQPGERPVDDQALQEYCRDLPGELTVALGRNTNVYACGFKPVAGYRSLYLEFDGLMIGTRSFQYHIPVTKAELLVITATSNMDSLLEMHRLLGNMIQTIDWL